MRDNKNDRIGFRVSKEMKEEFYEICNLYGLCPSILLERWISNFINRSKKNKIDFDDVSSAADELKKELEKYKNS